MTLADAFALSGAGRLPRVWWFAMRSAEHPWLGCRALHHEDHFFFLVLRMDGFMGFTFGEETTQLSSLRGPGLCT